MIVSTSIQMINYFMHPMPEGLNPANKDQMQDYISGLPLTAFLLVLVSWLAGGFAGAFAAGKIFGARETIYAAIFAILLIAAGTMNFFFLQHPMWMMGAAYVIFILAPFAGSMFAKALNSARDDEVGA
jgi:hypothetical protein